MFNRRLAEFNSLKFCFNHLYDALKQRMDPYVVKVNKIVDPYFDVMKYTNEQCWYMLVAGRKFRLFTSIILHKLPVVALQLIMRVN